MSESPTIPANQPDKTVQRRGSLTDAKRVAVNRKLQAYYQFECLRPTTERLQLLLDEMLQRNGAAEKAAADHAR